MTQLSPKMIKKLALLGVAVVAVALFFAFDLHQFFTLENLKDSRAKFAAAYEANTLLFLGAYFLIYVLMAALSLPGAAVLTLAAGALFGFWTGLLVVSFASSIGAAAACAVARYVLGGWVQRRFGDRLQRINDGVEREGAFYLFTLRLIPIFPFFVINLVMGLTRMRLWTFYWVSQLGMLPGTAVFVNAGVQLGQVESVGDVLSPSLLVSFALIGVFPLIAKKALGWYRAKQGLKATPNAAPRQ